MHTRAPMVHTATAHHPGWDAARAPTGGLAIGTWRTRARPTLALAPLVGCRLSPLSSPIQARLSL